MVYPLNWNDIYVYDLQIFLHQPKIFLLRDHMTLISDLISDWSTGPTLALPFFIPYLYKFKWFLTEAEINLCANEMNVINQPNDLNENGIIDFNLCIPSHSISSVLDRKNTSNRYWLRYFLDGVLPGQSKNDL